MTFLATLTEPLRKVRDRIHQNPVRDWFSILGLSFIALIGIVLWSVWTFDTVTKGGILGSSTISSPLPFSNDSLSTVHKIFDDRESEANKNEAGVYIYTDPSR